MSVYWCDKCDKCCDKLLDPCCEFPEGSNKLVCPDCLCEIEDENDELLAKEKFNEPL
jgi:hypothetical protein